MWNEVYICLVNLLHLPLEYNRPSILSLRRVADDRVLLMPKWCATIPQSLKKVIVWHLAEADAVLFYNLRYQSEPPSRSVSPSAPLNYCPPPVLESPPPTKLPLPPIVNINPSMAKLSSAQVSMTDEDPMPPPIPATIAAGVQPSKALVPSETPGTMDIDPAVPPISGVAAKMEPSETLVPSQTSGTMDIDPAIPSTPTVNAVVRSTETLGPSETFGTIGVDSTVPANTTIPVTANPHDLTFSLCPSHVHSIDLIGALMSLPEEPIPTSTWCFISLPQSLNRLHHLTSSLPTVHLGPSAHVWLSNLGANRAPCAS
ncbi:hypothetical protein BS47DRAFT_1402823 [Hydnum rufescens UP504]|uniref:Uncharacterized protein n=1 Tax=Hydnum rufescens UP504 TaxID=1448309 RepID=A0A9P6DFV1_9AGAM|nr:hypothetical protein BS47DRAFT_1402823 [Hydnum rufescens UP504]